MGTHLNFNQQEQEFNPLSGVTDHDGLFRPILATKERLHV